MLDNAPLAYGLPPPSLVHVASGEVRIGRNGEVLGALLGSCVAIGMIWPAAGRCGLAHCLLPESGGTLLRIGARHVDHAVASLLALMKAGDADKSQIEVVLAGGAAMLGMSRAGGAIGPANVAAAHKHLAASGLTVRHQETGGRRGRLIRIDCADQSFSIRKIASPTPEQQHAYL